jgi:hypothetical protein
MKISKIFSQNFRSNPTLTLLSCLWCFGIILTTAASSVDAQVLIRRGGGTISQSITINNGADETTTTLTGGTISLHPTVITNIRDSHGLFVNPLP